MRIGVLMPLISSWAIDVALRCADLGHEVHVIDFAQVHKKIHYLSGHSFFQQANIEKLNGRVQIHYMVTTQQTDLRYFTSHVALKAICQKSQVDILLILYGGGFATLAYLSRFRPYAIYTVGSDVLLANGIRRFINRHTYKAAEKIFSNGAYLAEKTKIMAHRSDVENLCMGVNTNRFKPVPRNEKDVTIISTRGFTPIYNNEYLIQALALMPDNIAYSKVVYTSAGPTLESAKATADQLFDTSTRTKICFMGGVSDEELLNQLNRASIYVSVSRSDGTSISLLEALSCGLFPILSDIPPNREWIDPALGNGILVPLDQPKALAQALERTILDDSLRARASTINRQVTLERADGLKNMAILTSKLEEIVDKYRQRAA
jgi:glycosyltransferase involved in cell wall biosynthesis